MADLPLRAAVAACGGIADLTLSAGQRSDDFEVVAVQDVDPRALARVGDRYGIARRHTEFTDLLTDDVDFVVINSPNHVHRSQVRDAARAGKHCLVQKPMAPTLDDAEAMVAAARDAGVRLGITMFELGKPLNHQCKAMVDSGWLGDPVLVTGTAAHDIYLKNPPAEDDWRRDPGKVGGAAFIQLAVHQVNLANWLLGEDVVAVQAVGARGHTVFEDESTLCTLRFSSGTLGRFAASYATDLWGFTIQGTSGRIQVLSDHVVVRGGQPFDGPLFTYDEPGREVVVPISTFAADSEAASDAVEVHGAFARWVAGRSDFFADGDRGLLDMRVVDAVYRSLSEEACIRID